MTDLTDLWDIPEPHGYHEHDGEQVPFYYTSSRIQKPGKEPEDIPFGLLWQFRNKPPFLLPYWPPNPPPPTLIGRSAARSATWRLSLVASKLGSTAAR